MTETVRLKSFPGWFVIGIFWALLFWMGHPVSYIDDLAYTGAAFNLADGGAFKNPYCPGLGLLGASEHFFIYMPLHSYVLAAWISIFGKSRLTLALFQCGCGALSSAAFWKLIFRRSEGWLPPLGVSVITAVYLGCAGLRPEALGLFFLAWGSWILISKSVLSWTLCSLALLLSLITCPNYLPFLPVIFACAFYLHHQSQGFNGILIRAGSTSATALMIGVLFLCLIHFELGTFITIFEKTRENAPGLMQSLKEAMSSFRSGLRLVVQTLIPAGFLVGMAGWAYGCPSRFEIVRIRFFVTALLATLGLLLVTVSSSSKGGHLFFYYCMMAGCFFATRLKPGKRVIGGIVAASVFAVYLLAIGHHTIQLVSMCVSPRPPSQSALRQKIEELHPTHVYVDNFALDVVYNYRLPAGVSDYHFNFSDRWEPYPALERFPKGSVLVLSKESVALMGRTHPDWTFIKMPFPGMAQLFPWTAENPYDCVLLQP